MAYEVSAYDAGVTGDECFVHFRILNERDAKSWLRAVHGSGLDDPRRFSCTKNSQNQTYSKPQEVSTFQDPITNRYRYNAYAIV